MKINEIAPLTGKELFEAIDRENDTGVKTSDLVRIVEAHRENKWQSFDTVEAFESYLNKLVEE